MSDPIVVCNMCYEGAEEIAVFNNDYALMFWDGKYHLISQPGHLDYIVYTFKNDPFADPDPDCTNEDESLEERIELWLDQLQEFEETFLVSPLEGASIVEAIKSAGWTPGLENHQHIMTWFYDHLGKLVEEHKNAKIRSES